MKIIWSPLALQRLEEIMDYISIDSYVNAEKFTGSIIQKVELLFEFPNFGWIVPELNNSDFRELIIGNYRIIYKLFQNNIHILFLRHSKRMLDKEEIK